MRVAGAGHPVSGPTTNMEKARDYLRRFELRPYWRKQKRIQRARLKEAEILSFIQSVKGGRVKKVKAVKPKLEDVRVKLAKLLHESGREAVETGNVVNKVPGQPFYSWDELTNEARSGRILMAKFLLDKRRRATLQGIFATA